MKSPLKVFGPVTIMRVDTPLKAWYAAKGWTIDSHGVKWHKLWLIAFGLLFTLRLKA